jgi:hypothetical protein
MSVLDVREMYLSMMLISAASNSVNTAANTQNVS